VPLPYRVVEHKRTEQSTRGMNPGLGAEPQLGEGKAKLRRGLAPRTSPQRASSDVAGSNPGFRASYQAVHREQLNWSSISIIVPGG